MFEVLNGLHKAAPIACIIEGGALGADRFARRWAAEHAVECVTFEADWKSYGRAAGPLRNARMLHEAKPDVVIAFPGGKGTANMVALAGGYGVPVREIME